eukprot:TRINITY_DN10406_c0_g1_i1.p1 TRINITY_DN10406_c0_g1~~TRINITY_DN10406_c0_g1_i1.p1  ORF type:complete len:958 (+),score=282.34 TRINITY_DN10406_c0_g1_i1:85-2874(+)
MPTFNRSLSDSSLSSSDESYGESPGRRLPRPPAKRPASRPAAAPRVAQGPAADPEIAGWELSRRHPNTFLSVADFRRELGLSAAQPQASRPATAELPGELAAAAARHPHSDHPPGTLAELRRGRAGRSRCTVYLDSGGCRYNVVRECAAQMGWEDDPGGPGERSPVVIWLDTSVSHERLIRLRSGTRVNHFPGMSLLCRKVEGARHLIKLKKLFPEAYGFVPPTYLDYGEFCNNQGNHSRRQWFILKPNTGCQGKGIRLVKNVTRPMFDGNVVQAYIPRPLLIDGFKWDMRVYVLVLSCDPLRVFMYKDGLVRMCTEQYTEPSEENADQELVHLTNYAVQRKSRKFVFNDDAGSGHTGTKRDFGFLAAYLRRHNFDPEQLWDKVRDLIVKTLISVQEHLRHTYRSCFPECDNLGTACFEVLGFDVLVDENLDPWLLEVNQAPSFACDTPLDHRIKRGTVYGAMALAGVEQEEAERVRARDRRLHAARLLTAACGQQYASAAACLEFRRQERVGGISREAAAFRARRGAYESQLQVGYTLIYPCPEPQRMQGYATLMQAGRAAELIGSNLGGVLPAAVHGSLLSHYAPLRKARQPAPTGNRSAALRGTTHNPLQQQADGESSSSDGDGPMELPAAAAAHRAAAPAAAVAAPAAAVDAACAAESASLRTAAPPAGSCGARCGDCQLCQHARVEYCAQRVRRLQQLLDDALRERVRGGQQAHYGDLRRVAERSPEVSEILDDLAFGPYWELTQLQWRELTRRAALTARQPLRAPQPAAARRPRSAPAAAVSSTPAAARSSSPPSSAGHGSTPAGSAAAADRPQAFCPPRQPATTQAAAGAGAASRAGASQAHAAPAALPRSARRVGSAQRPSAQATPPPQPQPQQQQQQQHGARRPPRTARCSADGHGRRCSPRRPFCSAVPGPRPRPFLSL